MSYPYSFDDPAPGADYWKKIIIFHIPGPWVFKVRINYQYRCHIHGACMTRPQGPGTIQSRTKMIINLFFTCLHVISMELS